MYFDIIYSLGRLETRKGNNDFIVLEKELEIDQEREQAGLKGNFNATSVLCQQNDFFVNN